MAKERMLLIIVANLVVIATSLPSASAAPCRECRKIKALESEYARTSKIEGLDHDKVANQITEIIGSMRKRADGTVDNQMIDAIIAILRLDRKDRWFRQLFVEKNFSFFKDNRAAFAERLKKIPSDEAAEINADIDIKFREMEKGNDPAGAPKSAAL